MSFGRLRRAFLSTVTAVATPTAADAQGIPMDHDRRFARIPIPNIEPSFTWLDDHRVLVKTDRGDGGVAFEVTDARTHKQRAAFDDRALAESLSAALGRRIEPSRLPITRVGSVRGALLALVEPELQVFAITDDGCGAEPFELADATPFLITPGERQTSSTGETTVRFVNRLPAEARVFWVKDGQRHAYGSLAPGQTRLQGTWIGHKWVVVDVEGAEYGPFVAEENAAIALVHPPTLLRRAAADVSRRATTNPAGWAASIRDHNITLRHGRSGETRQATTDGTPEDHYSGRLFWSDDGTHLLAFRTRPARTRTVHTVESSPRDQRQPKLLSFPYAKPGDPIDHHRVALLAVDTETGRASPVPIDNALFSNPRSRFEDVHWLPGGSEVVFSYVERGQRSVRVVGIDAGTGNARTLIEEAPETFFDWAAKMHFEPIREGREAIWMSERTGWNHLHRFDLV
ncbi:MAG: DPP IV N-terminal domain-containing protein, partial [Planctomycetota bacterium]